MDNKLISDTRGRLLDVAERQFMASGYEATSMRAITSATEVNLASVNYHFGSKERLLREVFRRRLAWLNKERIASLDLLNGPFKSVVAGAARKQVAKRARLEHYPAPYAIIELWAGHNGNALAAPDLIDSIVRSSTARNLVRVTLQDQGMERVAPALVRAYAAYGKRIRDKLQLRDVMDLLIPDPEGYGAAQADVVIEAIYEKLEAKQVLLKKLEGLMKPEAVLATNTSSLKLEDLRTVLSNPARLVGIHFFNPVAKMPLVEVVSADGGDPEVALRAAAFVRQIDRLPLPVKSAPGFLVNAVLGPYMLEAMRAVDEGLSPETVDEAMLAFGMPMGPIELVDMVGLDVAMAAGKGLAGVSVEPPKCLVEHFNAAYLGKKSGKGFYDYSTGKPEKRVAGNVPVDLAERLIAPLLERTQQLVDAGIVADAGVIFGTGFAPFTGGPLNYMKTRTEE